MRVLKAAILSILLGPAAFAQTRLSDNRATEPVAGYKLSPAVTSSASGFLVAWLDTRGFPIEDGWLRGAVRMMRLDADGQREDERDFGVGASRTAGNVYVASDGRDYLVAYGTDDSTNTLHTRFARVPAHREPPVVSDFDLRAPVTQLVFSGGVYVASGGYQGASLFVLDRSGNFVRSIRIGTGNATSVKLAEAGVGRLFVAWSTPGGMRAKVVMTEDLLTRDDVFADALILGGGWPAAAAVREGTILLLSWIGTQRVGSTLISTAGVRLTPTRYAFDGVSAASRWRAAEYFAVATRSGFAILTDAFWSYEMSGFGDLREGPGSLSLDDQGCALDTEFRPVAAGQAALSVHQTFDGQVVLAGAAGESVVFQKVMPGRDEGVVVSMSRASEEDATVTTCGSLTLVGWREVFAGGQRLRYRNFAADGTPLGPPQTVQESRDGRHLGAFCDGEAVVAVWRDEQRVHAASFRAAWAGSRRRAVSTSTYPIILEQGYPFTFDGTGFVSVTATTSSGTRRFFTFTRSSNDGRVTTSEPIVVDTGKLPGLSTYALSWNGREFLLAWVETFRAPDEQSRLRGLRLASDFKPIGSVLDLARVAKSDAFQRLQIAASPEQWMLGWSPGGDYSQRLTSWTLIVNRDGVVLDAPTGVLTGIPAFGSIRQMSWNGSAWEIVTGRAVTTRRAGESGRDVRLLGDDARLEGISPAGNRRLLVSTRVDPYDGIRELFFDVIPPPQASSFTP